MYKSCYFEKKDFCVEVGVGDWLKNSSIWKKENLIWFIKCLEVKHAVKDQIYEQKKPAEAS